MNQATASASLVPELEQEDAPLVPYTLKELSAKHMQVISLTVQGVPRQLIGDAVGFTPAYVTWLMRQPLVAAKFKEFEEAETSSTDPTGQNLAEVISLADYKIESGTTVEKLYAEIDRVLSEISRLI